MIAGGGVTMDRVDTTPRVSWFVIVGFFASFLALALLPMLASVAASLSPWAAIAAVVAVAALLSVAVTETWKHLPS
jgi:hypothetical protein